MKKNNNRIVAAVAAIVLMMVMCGGANAQIIRSGKNALASRTVPTQEQKEEVKKAENVTLLEQHGSRNFYVAAAYAYGINSSEHYVGAEAGFRFSEHFKLGVQGMWCATKDVVQHHSFVVLKPSFDLVDAESSFYKKTGLDFSIHAMGGVMSQAELKIKGGGKLLDNPCNPQATAGAGCAVVWNVAPHFQLSAGVSYLYLFREKELVDYQATADMTQAEMNWIEEGNWQKGIILAEFKVAYHF